MKLRKYTESQLREAVRTSYSMRQVLDKLNVASYGGNYDVLRKALKYFEVDTSHFTFQGWSKGMKFGPKKSLDTYLNGYPITSHKLRLRLIEEKIFDPICSNCRLDIWLDRPIPLELDHIDGNNKNNSLDNLRLLCPNCHALTSTYRGKNKSSKKLGSVLPADLGTQILHH